MCNTAIASMKSRTVVIIDIADHGPAQVGVGGGRGCAQDGGRGGAHVAAIQGRHRGAPTGDHSKVSPLYALIGQLINESTDMLSHYVNCQENIGGGRSQSEGLQGPARLLGGPPGQVLALLVEVSHCTRIYNEDCPQNVRKYFEYETFQAHGYQVLKATGLACPRHFRAHGSGKYGLNGENSKKKRNLEKVLHGV